MACIASQEDNDNPPGSIVIICDDDDDNDGSFGRGGTAQELSAQITHSRTGGYRNSSYSEC